MLASITAPFTGILPGGCLPPHITPTLPVEPKPWERNCWDPTKWGSQIQLPSPDSEIQAVKAAALLG
jgi:hypothetical protein